MQVDLPLSVFRLEEVVSLRSPRLLLDFDCAAVRGNVFNIDPRDRAVDRDDADTSGDTKLLDALLLRFVEDLIVEGSITCWSHATEVQSILPATSKAG